MHTPKNIQAEWHKPLFDKGINDTEIYRFFDAIDEYMQIEDQKNLDQFDLDSKKLVSACKRLNWKIVPARRAVQSCKRRNQCGLDVQVALRRLWLILVWKMVS